MTEGEIEAYLDNLKFKGRVDATRKQYSRALYLFYNALPAEKRIAYGSVAQWRDTMIAQGYANKTINFRTSVVNSFLEFLGHREYQMKEFLNNRTTVVTEDMTRSEYLRILQTARLLEKEQIYLIIKLIVLTGIRDQDLRKVTKEAVEEGTVSTTVNGKPARRKIPPCLQQELLDFAWREGIQEGILFFGKSKKNAIHRSYVAYLLQRLCEEANIPIKKGNIRCLRKLYQQAKMEIRSNLDFLLEEAYEKKMEQEQCYVGWENREKTHF